MNGEQYVIDDQETVARAIRIDRRPFSVRIFNK